MEQHLIPCRSCSRLFPAAELDAKPELHEMLPGETHVEAADRGLDLTRFECRECYGPGYSEL